MSRLTIHNPDNDAHFMRVRPVKGRVTVTRGGTVLATTSHALRVLETGQDVYDPVLYIPQDDLGVDLEKVPGKTTHCPLKGDCAYFALDGEEIGWSYDRPLPLGGDAQGPYRLRSGQGGRDRNRRASLMAFRDRAQAQTGAGSAGAVLIRPAVSADLPAIIAMFASDTLGGHGDSTEPQFLPAYRAAFERIMASPNDTLYVAERAGNVVGTFQTTSVTTLTGRGASVLIIEAVHTRLDCRGQGIGEAMIRHAIDEGRARGVRLVQLTSNAARKDAHRFYERLGFAPSHLGFKMKL